jgi:ABC-type multidrug transport system fused ATPase/permease subunit
MTMGTIYQLTFFLALALLAIVITVFVLAVSLLGRAVRIAAEEQEESEKEQKYATEKEIKRIQDQIGEAQKTGQLDIEGLGKTLKGLKGKNRKHEWKLRWIRIKPKLLTASWGALVPGAFFLISVIFSALALYVPDEASTALLYMWIALITMFVGICFVCLTLKVIEGVAITSDETAFVRQKEILTTALREFEEEKKPVLGLQFRGQQPPFHIKLDAETKLEFLLGLIKGDVADNVTANFYLRPGFSFPGIQSIIQAPDHPTLPNFVTARVDYGLPITRGADIINELVIKAPPKAGSFPGYYGVRCRGFAGGLEKFEIIVEEADIPL